MVVHGIIDKSWGDSSADIPGNLGKIDAAFQRLYGFTLESHPTEEGKRRYEPDGLYTVNGNATPCTCVSACPTACKGGCGCDACSEAYGDYLSSQGD